MDVGCGTGILSIFFAQAGAKRGWVTCGHSFVIEEWSVYRWMLSLYLYVYIPPMPHRVNQTLLMCFLQKVIFFLTGIRCRCKWYCSPGIILDCSFYPVNNFSRPSRPFLFSTFFCESDDHKFWMAWKRSSWKFGITLGSCNFTKTCFVELELGIEKGVLWYNWCLLLPLVGACSGCDDSMSYCLKIFTVKLTMTQTLFVI